MALTASANSSLVLAGEYGGLQGQCVQNVSNPYILNTSTGVTKNENGALLEMHIDLWGIDATSALYTFSSELGSVLLARDIPLYPTIDFEPERVFVDHQLCSSDGDLLYEVCTSEVFSFS